MERGMTKALRRSGRVPSQARLDDGSGQGFAETLAKAAIEQL